MKNKLFTLLIISTLLNLVLVSYLLKPKIIQNPSVVQPTAKPAVNTDEIFEQINPAAGYQTPVKFGNLGPKLISLGVIDLPKFKSAYANSGAALPAGLEKILTYGSDDKITITRDNSYFLLNFFWAVGLANKSRVLDSGEMSSYGGRAELGNFASTGGWSLGKSEAMNYYSKGSLISLTTAQQELVSRVAGNIYRPCCNNSTAFPDCNHGMALLGVLELLASNDTSENDMYRAAKYFNAFWFPGNYYDLAVYFKNKNQQNFADINPKIILSKEFSSAAGSQIVKKWLVDNQLVKSPPNQGGSCGV